MLDLLEKRSTTEIEWSAVAIIVYINPACGHFTYLLTIEDLLGVHQTHGGSNYVRPAYPGRGRRKLPRVREFAAKIEAAQKGKQLSQWNPVLP
jgi:hypothetical protein